MVICKSYTFESYIFDSIKQSDGTFQMWPYFIDRTKQIIKCIEKAMGKTISGLDSEDTIREFGVSLSE